MTVAELATKFSFTGSLAPLDKLNSGLKSGITQIVKLGSAVTATGIALNGYIAHILESSDEMGQLSKETGVSVETIQELGYAASQNGSSLQALETSLRGLSKTIGEASIQGNADFSRLGISVRDSTGRVKTASEVMMELMQRFKQLHLSVQEQRGYLERLGIDQSMLQTLDETSGQLQKLMNKAKALGVVTTKQSKEIMNFNDSLDTLKYGFNSIQKQIAIAFAPQMKNLTNNFIDFLIANKRLIENGLKKFFIIVNSGLGAVWNFGKMIYKLIDGANGATKAIAGIGLAILVLNKLTKKNLIALAIMAVIAVINDLDTALKGGKSVINEWLESWFGVSVPDLLKDIIHLLYKVGKVANIIAKPFKEIAMSLAIMRNDKKLEAWLMSPGKPKKMTAIQKKMFNSNPIEKRLTEMNLNKIKTPNIVGSNIQHKQINNLHIEIKTTADAKTTAQYTADRISEIFNKGNNYFNKGGR